MSGSDQKNGIQAVGQIRWQPQPPRRLRCYKCGYEWDTKSRMKYVTCTCCHYKIDSAKCLVMKVGSP